MHILSRALIQYIFAKPVWHWLTGPAPSLSALPSFLLNHHLSHLFSPPSPVLSHASISFPLFPLPLFFTRLCSWFSVLFMKSYSPRVCLNCILQKKAPQIPALASHNSPNAISSDFVCMICWGYLLFFVGLVNPEPLVFSVFIYVLFNAATLSVYVPWPIRGVCECVCLYVCACYIILPQFLYISSSITLAYFHHDSSLLAAMYFQFTPICESQRAGVEAAGLDWGVIWAWNGWTFSPAECLP